MSETKKILIATGIFPPDIGGPATYADIIVKALTERNFDVKVITYSKSRKPKDEKTNISRVSKKWPWLIRHIIYATKVFFAGRKCDIIYSLSTINGSISSLISAKFFKKKFYIRIAGDYAWQVAMEKEKTEFTIDDFQEGKKEGWIKFLFVLQKSLCKKADLVIVPSEYLECIVKKWGIAEDKVKIIYNAVELKPLLVSKEEARNKIGIHGNIIMSIGRLAPWKGFKMLVKIMPRLLELNQFFRLVIIGEGPDRKNLEAMIKNLGLDKKVYLLGKKPQSELPLYLAAADIFVLNSGYEGFSHQILESMALGVPVIASAVMGNRELIHQGQNGFMVKYNDEFNLIEAIKTLHQDDVMKNQFIVEGRKTAEFFSVGKMIGETEKIFNFKF